EMHAADAAIITKNGRSSARVHRGNTSTAPSCQLRPVNRGVQLTILREQSNSAINAKNLAPAFRQIGFSNVTS
ncbi:hypothetical protein, partial [Agrobacterium vitis]|uniref:hypothetical protein n=1 Tax=Agrobacterium vitis TaxID=373 RepID=UPI001AEDE78F